MIASSAMKNAQGGSSGKCRTEERMEELGGVESAEDAIAKHIHSNHSER
jgi:hypothetical protein